MKIKKFLNSYLSLEYVYKFLNAVVTLDVAPSFQRSKGAVLLRTG